MALERPHIGDGNVLSPRFVDEGADDSTPVFQARRLRKKNPQPQDPQGGGKSPVHRRLEAPFLLDDFENLHDVVFIEVLEIGEAHAALVACGDFTNIVLEPLEAG